VHLRFLELTTLHRQSVPLFARSRKLSPQARHLLCKRRALPLRRVKVGSCLKPELRHGGLRSVQPRGGQSCCLLSAVQLSPQRSSLYCCAASGTLHLLGSGYREGVLCIELGL
jgi:hypothetical protein